MVTSTNPETTVLVAVRAPKVREAVVAMIGALEGFTVVAEAGSGQQAILAARTHRPALAVVDQDLGGCGGAWTVQTLREERIVPAIVAIGMRADDGTRYRAFGAGAQSYVQTGAPTEDILAALNQALSSSRSRRASATAATSYGAA